MTKEEYTELRRMVDEVHGGDVQLGRVLHAMLDHLGDMAGVNKAAKVEAGAKAGTSARTEEHTR
jgi:hypothetical protein